MCGIFGFSSNNEDITFVEAKKVINTLFTLSESRGRESAGICIKNNDSKEMSVYKAPISASELIRSKSYNTFLKQSLGHCFDQKTGKATSSFSVLAHARLVTNGAEDSNDNNQPVIKDGAVGVHNGIICNIDDLWQSNSALKRVHEVDSEFLLSHVRSLRGSGENLPNSIRKTLQVSEGTIAAALLFEDEDSLPVFTNYGSIYYSIDPAKKIFLFSSEKFILEETIESTPFLSSQNKQTVHPLRKNKGCILDLSSFQLSELDFDKSDSLDNESSRYERSETVNRSTSSTHPASSPMILRNEVEKYFEDNSEEIDKLKRCTKCLLPETFPFIEFDEKGVCNLCNNYQKLQFSGKDALLEEAKPYRKNNGEPDCLVTLSGGRDSCYGLHYVKEELGLNPIAYTYDWGMVTDLARRNSARLCGKLGVEHIIISADIRKKRENIRKNVTAWLKKPHLGTVPLFMAGDKQYFYYANQLKQKYQLPLTVLCENMLETTNFKTGFCGIAPEFDTSHTFSLNFSKKLKMMLFYGTEFLKNPAYINSSLSDSFNAFSTYYFMEKKYLNLFRFIEWKEKTIEQTLISNYNWEVSPDTPSTWRIGDGTAAFYNYIYYNVAGLSEFDTFRSNEIREGQLDRETALQLVRAENKPRIESFLWYCSVIKIDPIQALKVINAIPKLYRKL